ncbi:MAG: hypothetical protein R6X20_04045 [Phycisphaerae bacterium]
MRNLLPRPAPAGAAVAVCLLALAAGEAAAGKADANAARRVSAPAAPKTATEIIRELYVPFEDLSPILQGDPNRVLLSRKEYESLRQRAEKEDERRPPRSALVASADYQATLGEGRAEITGKVTLSVLAKGLHAVGLDVAGVGLRSAMLDGKPAPIGLADDGRLTLFVQGVGTHELSLQVVAPVETTAARQTLSFRLPVPPASRMRLTVPGDVEVKAGAPVASRVFDEQAEVTRIEILPKAGQVTLVMTLNSRLLRRDRVVVARSVLLDEVTAAYERLHATVSMEILHRAVGRFRFAVPDGFDVTDVRTPNLSAWAIEEEGGRRVLDVRLREDTTETTVLNLSAVRTAPDLADWSLARFEPLDVVGHVSVVGVAVEERLKAEALETEGLIPIDTAVLTRALPATVLEPQPGAARIRPVAAYYAPQAALALSARMVRPPARLLVTTNVLAVLADAGLTVSGGFALVPEQEKRFAFDFAAPAGWDVTAVTDAQGNAIPFQRYEGADGGSRIHVRLPSGAAPGTERRVFFQARHVPDGWFGEWDGGTRTVEFPVFAVLRAGQGDEVAVRDTGAIAVEARDDLLVRPDALEGLLPLDANEKKRFGLEGTSASLAYRYDRPPYRARLSVRREEPRMTAQTFSFFRVERDALAAHYEITYEVGRARARRLSLVLPAETPAALAIRGLGGARIKEQASELVGEGDDRVRRWTAMLARPRRGTVRLAVDFEQRLEELEPKDLALPLVRADGVAYQSGLVAVEGSAELDVRVTEHPRKVDIGELVDAEYQAGRRLLGAYGFLGDPPPVRVSVTEHPGLGLPPAVVQRAELATVLSADGLAQTAARFLLKTKSLFLDVRLPADSTLWSATLDGRPVKPRREGERLLLNLPGGGAGQTRDLRVVYASPVSGLAFWKGTQAVAPRLFLHAAEGAEAREVPAADLVWHLYPPSGYRVVRTEGTVVTHEVQPPPLAVANVAGALYYGTGGVNFDHGAVGLALDFAGLLQLGLPSSEGPSAEMSVPADGYYYDGDDAAEGNEDARRLGAAARGPLRLPKDAESGAARRPTGEAPAEEQAGIRAQDGPVVSKGVEPGMETEELKTELPRPMFEGTPAMVPQSVTRPETAPAETPARPAEPEPKAPAKPKPTAGKKNAGRAVWALEGLTSLTIDLHRTGPAVEFRSLGADPAMAVTCVDETRLGALAWGLALAVFVLGVALTTRPFGSKAAYVVGVGVVATLLPVVTGRIELALAVNGAFYAACLLVPYYVAAGVGRWVWGKVAGLVRPRTVSAPAAVLLAAVLVGFGAGAQADEKDRPYVVQIVPPTGPVKVPADAIILPYDPASKEGVRGADRLLVPYARYVELWNRAYPDKPIGETPPPAPYALAGAAFTATVEGEGFLRVDGHVDIDVFTDEYVTVPLPLAGGVLSRADLDGAAARVSVVEPQPKQAAKAAKQQARPSAPALVALYVEGKGRHRLEVTVRLHLERRGGWRVAEGHLPAAPATSLTLTVPKAGTELRLGHVQDRAAYETTKAGETIETALGARGALRLQWRAKVGEGQIEKTLTAVSRGVLDIQEDRLHLLWDVRCEFRHGEREAFTLTVPADYTVEKVEGTNVRGWQRDEVGGRGRLTVSLLKPAKGQETFTVTLWRQTAEGAAPRGGEPFDAPLVEVAGALRHTGLVVIRRSPLMDVRTVETDGVRRADLPPANRMPPPEALASPLGVRPYQAYQFVATPFTVRLAAEPVEARVSAQVQMILRLAERERRMEARAVLAVEDRPLYRARLAIPETLDLERVQAPGAFEWAVTEEAGRRILTVYLSAGVEGPCPIVVEGRLARGEVGTETPLPRVEVLDVQRQRGDIVVQVDPAFDVRPADLDHIERVLLKQVGGWLNAGQKALAALALTYRRPDYRGRLVMEARRPDVACYTVTNARVTDRTVDETILLTWTIQKAGIREVAFLLPRWMAEARIRVPLLREKTVEPAGEAADAPVRVRLTLQDQVMDELRVLVENDRLLEGEEYEAPIPVVETGRTSRRYVALESAGRDEVVVTAQEGLEPLGRRQKEWSAVAGLLRGGTTRAFIVTPGAESPRLAFETRRRKVVETPQARIGLAETLLVLDAAGTYRGRVIYRLDNRTEQFLEVEMPEGADLWTAVVAGEPVKPTRMEAGAAGRRVRIPIVKTAEGELDYAVVLKYGGRVGGLGAGRYSVRFPLVRAINIEAELSQVRLFVPEEYEWFWFDSVMSPVEEAGTLDAGVLQYQWKQARRLLQTLQSDNPFAKTRAYSNLKQIGRSIQMQQERLQTYSGNTAVQEELSNAGVILESVNKELKTQPQAGQVTVTYNDDLMRRAYGDQRNRRDRNLVQDVGANWSIPAARPDDDQRARGWRFNDAWLEETQLENKAAQKQQAEPQARFQGGAQQMRQQAAQAQAQPQAEIAGDMFKQFAGQQMGEEQAEAARQDLSDLKRRHETANVVERYQKKLEAREKVHEEVRRAAAGEKRESELRVIGGWEGRGEGRGFFGAGGEVPAEKAVPQGLASLDVELPERGRLFRFTMPMPPEDVAIEATAASEAVADGTARAAGVLAVLLVLLGLRRWLRGRSFDVRTQSLISTVMIILGVFGVVLGIFPLAGLAAVLVGAGMKVYLFFERRSGTATA